MGAHGSGSPGRWCISGGVALLAHLAVMHGLPQPPVSSPAGTGPGRSLSIEIVDAPSPAGPEAPSSATTAPRSRARASSRRPEPIRARRASPPPPRDEGVEAALASTGGAEREADLDGDQEPSPSIGTGRDLFGAQGAAESGLGSGPGGDDEVLAPRLLARGDPCAGFFPAGAREEQGEVRVSVWVDPNGRSRASAILAERPMARGFGSAARGCVEHLTFAPARDRLGTAVAGRAELRIRFRRR